MAGWWQRLTGDARPAAAGGGGLPPWLQGYPAYEAPHGGVPKLWTAAQAQANFEHLQAALPQRLAAVQGLLAAQGIDEAPAALSGADPAPLLKALHRWTLAAWPALRGPTAPATAQWLASPRSGPQLAYALLLDLALLLGELAVRRRPGVAWGLDRDSDNIRDDMATVNRTVLLLDRSAIGRPPLALDIEGMVFERFSHIDSPTQRLVDRWAQTIGDVINGQYQRA